jgi:hypothetical protein
VAEKYSLDVAMPRIKDLFERTAARKREPSTLMSNLMKTGTLTSHPVDIDTPKGEDRAEISVAAGSATDIPSAEADERDAQLEPGSDLAKSVIELRRISTGTNDPLNWVKVSQSFRGPKGPLETIGPSNHPIDFARLAQRVYQWQPQTILDVGAVEGGSVFIWTRMGTSSTHIIVAPVEGRIALDEKIALMTRMARDQQTIRYLPLIEDAQKMEKAIDRALDNRQVDLLFLHGRRPYRALAADYRRYRKKVRPGGLIGWDGINLLGKTTKTEGGDRLWTEVKPMFPQHAEYLNGIATEHGGIAMIKV